MKRSEMIEYIKSELEDMIESINNRPNAAKYASDRFANNILDMIEGFGILPPKTEVEVEVMPQVTMYKQRHEWEKE